MKIFEIEKNKLYQSPSITHPEDFTKILEMGIDVILDIDGKEDLVDSRLVYFLFWPIEDKEAPSQIRLDMVAKFGLSCIQNGLKVLVHCGEGVNRSSLVSARILMMLKNIKAEEAIAQVKKNRSGAFVNKNFVNLLQSININHAK